MDWKKITRKKNTFLNRQFYGTFKLPLTNQTLKETGQMLRIFGRQFFNDILQFYNLISAVGLALPSQPLSSAFQRLD
ncbi:hypothetical protein [Desulfosarcina sp. BuS5]|uniref:hypothetical protein n=1 Tax=Desulfosarcina sp. BuS5 TaxID=933262 RepID=UPI00047F5B09|nr:hypothetical protein [Desulfosarcina sp. BuS5]